MSARSHPGKQPVHTRSDGSNPSGRAKQELDYGRRPNEGYVFGAFIPATGRSSHRNPPLPLNSHLRGFLRESRGLGASRSGSHLRNPRQPQDAQSLRCLAVQPGAPSVGVRLPAQVRRLPQSHRTLVEDPQVTGAQRPQVRDLGRRGGGHREGDRLLERASSSVYLGPSQEASTDPNIGFGGNAEGSIGQQVKRMEFSGCATKVYPRCISRR